jgi:1,4-alpha-glucan branching enzyme
MTLSEKDLQSLVELKNSSPHQLLGLHSLPDGSGLVARAFLPQAAKVEVQPVLEKDMPAFTLDRIPKTDLFEGTTTAASRVYAYDLVVTDRSGNIRRTRDPYSFLPTISDPDLYLFGQGDERRLYDKFGAQLRTIDGVTGASFAVWAPNAQRISVIGDFNNWDGRCHLMRPLGASGVWEIFIPGVQEGAQYKYEIRNRHGHIVKKTDPFGFYFSAPPKNNAIVWNNRKFEWTDQTWLAKRRQGNPLQSPVSIYEIHLGCWRKKSATEFFSYRELA